MQTDFREERKWKIAVAMELAYSALEWHRADGEQRQELTVRWKIPLTDDELDADRVKEEVMEVEMRDEGREEESPPARRFLRDSALVVWNAENEAQPVTRRTGATITIRQDLRQDDEDDADDDDDEEDDETAAKAVEKQAAIDAVNAVREAAEDLEAHAREEQVPKIEPDDSPQEPSTKAGSDADGDGDPDEDMDAEGEADDVDGPGDPNNEENPEPLGIPDAVDMDASISVPIDTQDPQTSGADVHREGLKANGEDAALSSTATSILDPQTLRSPVLDLELEDTVINLSELLNRSLAMTDSISTPDKFDIALPALFPELNVYSFSTPPKVESIDKKNKRIDESGMSSGRLTLTTRLLDSKNVLVSALQPGQRYRRGVWEDTNDIPGMDESFSQLRTDAIPPAARKCFVIHGCIYVVDDYFPAMFCGSKPQDHVHPNQSQPPPDPNEKDARLQHFTWTTEEDQQLKALHSQFPTNWSLISDVFNSSRVTIPTDVRSAWDCYQRLSSISKLDVKDEHPVGRLGTPSEFGRSSTVPKEGWNSKASVKKPPPAQSKAVGKRATRHALLHDAIRKTIKKREFKPAGA
jgi:chromatin modification-related protein VID21